MIIDYNDFYRLRVDIYKVNAEPLYQLILEKVNLNDNAETMETTTTEYFFKKEQLKQFVDYINGATNDYI